MRRMKLNLKPPEFASSLTLAHLSEFRVLYNISQDHELIFPNRHERATTSLLLPPPKVLRDVRGAPEVGYSAPPSSFCH